jgi:hypothetical protein
MTEEATEQRPVADAKRRLRVFACVVFVVFVLLYCVPLVVVRLPGIERWEMSPGAVDLDYTFRTPHIDADVVLIGESSALYGIDPRPMSAALGVKVVNLANTLQSLPVIAELQLDRYLAQNKRPRLLVFYLTPWDLDFFNSRLSRYDGDEALLRQGGVADIVRYGERRPFELLTFPFQFYAANTLFSPARREWPPTGNMSIVRQLGHTDLVVDKPLSGGCQFPEELLRQSGKTASVQTVVERYRGSADAVVVYAAPIPNCGGYAKFLNLPYKQMGVLPPVASAAEGFGDDTYYAHPMPGAVPATTERLIAALRPSLSAK